MKDIERIQSTELAVQVQDANPGNFAIEQEVGAMVGATVPAPTAPSADDARELGAQLLVFLRRALTPIQTAMRTAVAAIYAHLDSRCTDYTPAAYAPFTPTHHAYDPMGSTPRTLPNLLTALTAFSARKISNGSAPSDGIPDGTSLARLIADGASVTELIDDTRGWIMTRNLNAQSVFPNLNKMTLGCGAIDHAQINCSGLDEINTPDLGHVETPSEAATFYNITAEDVTINVETVHKDNGAHSRIAAGTFRVIRFPKLKSGNLPGNDTAFVYSPNLEELYMDVVDDITESGQNYMLRSDVFKKVVYGKLKSIPALIYAEESSWGSCKNLIYMEVGEGTACNLPFNYWSPTNALDSSRNDLVTDEDCHNNLEQFLKNFREHIALRLTSNGSGKTLTLSQAVRDAIHAAEATYGIEAIIVTQKGWTLSPAPTA